jgi:hypothetical protein
MADGLRAIRGQVTEEGRPTPDVGVEALVQRLRTQEPIGHDHTHADGRYEIPYELDAASFADGASVEIVVRATREGSGGGSAEARTRIRVGDDAEVDLELAPTGAASEWMRIGVLLKPLLAGQGEARRDLTPWDLTEDDASTLAADSGLPPEPVRIWVLAARAVHEQWPDALFDDALEFVATYGWFRGDRPQPLHELLLRPPNDLLEALETAAEEGWIPALDRSLRARMTRMIAARHLEVAAQPARPGEAAGAAEALRIIPRADVLELDKPDGLGRRLLARLLAPSVAGRTRPEVIREVVGDDALAASIERSLRLRTLTGGHLPLMEALLPRSRDPTVADLVALDEVDWVKLAQTNGVPPGIEAPTEEDRQRLYGRQLARDVERMHPTAFLANRVATRRIPVREVVWGPLQTFLAANPGLRFKDEPVLEFLARADLDPAGLEGDQIRAVGDELLKLERIGRLTPSLDYVGGMITSGYESARDVVLRHSRDVFVAEIAEAVPDAAEAGRIYDAAAGVVASTEGLVLSQSLRFSGPEMPVLPVLSPPNGAVYGQYAATAAGTPIQPANLQQLFGSQDRCECAHGASLYGPAAYLADLLQMLARGPRHNDRTALDVLLARRPDLAEVDLTGDNADIALPYIDLVLDVLEAPAFEAGLGFRVLRGGTPQNPTNAFDAELDKGAVPQALADDLATWSLPLGAQRTAARGVDVKNAAGVTFPSWLIRDGESGMKLRLIGVIPGAYRLRAYPQSVAGATRGYRPWSRLLSSTASNVAAARFPWALPFDISRDEANTWLGHLGASREQVLLAFLGAGRWADVDAACEALEIARASRDVLTTALSAAAPDHRDWGFPNPTVGTEGVADPIAGATGAFVAASGLVEWTGPDGTRFDPPQWHALLKNVSLLRLRAGLSHRELLAVLETRFVRDGGPRLDITGAECNPGLMRLEAMDAPLARRIHLFVRTWRDLGWSTTDLDRAIAARANHTSGTGSDVVLTPAFLLFAAGVARLHRRSGLPVADVLDLLAGSTLDTTPWWDHSWAQPVLALSRYALRFDNPNLARPRLPELRLNAAATGLEAVAMPSSGLPRMRATDHLAYIAAALGLPEREFMALMPTAVMSIAPERVSGAGRTGATVDVGDAPLKNVEVVVGALSQGATFALLVEHSADGQTFAAVPGAQIGGANPITIDATASRLRRFAYSGPSRFLRTSVSSTGGTTPTLWMTTRILTAPGIVDDELSLGNLTTLCKWALLRRLTDRPIDDLRTLIALTAADPLAPGANPGVALQLLDDRDAIAAAGMSIAAADQLLRGPTARAAATLEQQAETLLAAARGASRSILDESTVAPAQTNVLLTTVLTSLGWDQELIARVVSADALAIRWADYDIPLGAVPAGVTLPASLTFDSGGRRLTASRTVRPAVLRGDLAPLLGAATGDFQQALAALDAEAARRETVLVEVQSLLRAVTLPTHRVSVGAATVGAFDVTHEWEARFYLDREAGDLCFTGWMSTADADALKLLAGTPPVIANFTSLIDNLRAASVAYQPAADNTLVVHEGGAAAGVAVEALLLDTVDLQERAALLLGRILPSWRRDRLHAKLQGALAEALGSDPETAAALLALPATTAPAGGTLDFATLVTSAALLTSDPATRPSRTAFPVELDAAARLLVLGGLARAVNLDAAEVPWLRGAWTTLDLTGVPTQRSPSPPAGVWSSLVALSKILALRQRLEGGSSGVRQALAAAQGAMVDQDRLAAALGYDAGSLQVLEGSDGLNVTGPAWLRDPAQLLQLTDCVGLAVKLNVPADLLVGLRRVQAAGRPVAEAEAEAQALRHAALAGGATEAADAVLDKIRLRRRDATVAHLVQQRGLRDAGDLYGYALIDPEMGPCMETSRIVQAIGSVQLFVQRCLLGLEPDAPPSAVNRDHWEWMKNYRVWEANRKVLLYPENWIEPELRDDKTPFFDEVVSALEQGDATSDKAQVAVQTFLERLTDFSRMEILGTCSEYDDQNRLLASHLFGRTLSEPRGYYHREFRKVEPEGVGGSLGLWSSWQAIAVDIEGDNLIPVIWQGRLFLFWAILITEADDPPAAQLQQGQGGPPTKYWRLKIGWSELKSGAWTGRRLAQDDLSNKRVVAASPTPNSRTAAASKDRFYFHASVTDDGVTLTGEFLNMYYSSYEPFATLFFDGQRVVRADGSYAAVTGTAAFRFVQTAAQHAEAPVDGSPPDDIPGHAPTGVPSSSGTALAVIPKGGQALTFFSAIPRRATMLFSPDTVRFPFSAPPPSATAPIPTAMRTLPFVVADRVHEFFVYPTLRPSAGVDVPGLHFYALDWPPAQRLRKILTRNGIDGLLSVDTQNPAAHPPVQYFSDYHPVASVVTASPDGGFEYSAHSASSTYNYELFFHAPFAIACALSKNQRFEEARSWFHHVFDPTDSSTDPSPARYWRFWPFRQSPGLALDELLRRLADPNDSSTEKLQFQAAIAAWKDQPFKPHLVARMRPRSYMYAVVMKYIDNLLDWADQLFRRDTRESINEATQLYILAAQILGRRPEGIPPRTRPVVKAFTELAASRPDDLTNAWVDAENLIPPATSGGTPGPPTHLSSLYFCLPGNPKLDDYHSRVEDRLYKLRHCMNIDGAERDLALFSPPIDPGLVVRAAAAGVDLAAVLADSQAPLPLYRFSVMAQKATELCGEVKSLGAALLSAIEKGDAEELALLRSGHESAMLHGIRVVKETQLLEAKSGLDSLGDSLQSAQTRFTHYVGLVSELAAMSLPTGPVVATTLERLSAAALEVASEATGLVQASSQLVDPITSASFEVTRQLLSRAAEALASSLPPQEMQTSLVPMNAAEQRQLTELKSAHDLQEKAADQRHLAQILAFIPDFTFGAQGWASSPVVQLQLGGTLLSKVADLAAGLTDSKAGEHTYRANLHNILASYQRRAADWLLQAQLASWEIAQLGEQIKAQTLRVAIASQELANHDLQAAQAREQDELMHGKFSNQELFNWMTGRLAALHFQAYQLAYDTARRAERCFNNELGVESSFIEFGYWDSLRRGLLAGESLMADIKRMEVAYVNQNARELEITKRLSLRELDPLALLRLQETGECRFTIPEVLFDIDFPGHYFRRIKAMRVSIPCVVGPYTSVSATLTLLSSKIRTRSTAFQGTYDREENFRTSSLPAQAIATSTGQDDAGMFELSFRDERYLPFEGAGAISSWHLELPGSLRPFDYSTIADVILHVHYTARSAGGALKQLAEASLIDAVNQVITSAGGQGFAQAISLRQEFPTEWAQLTSSAPGAVSTAINVTKRRFPFLIGDRKITLGDVDLYAVPAHPKTDADIDGLKVTLPGATQSVTMTDGESIGRLQAKAFTANLDVAEKPQDAQWTLAASATVASALRATVEDIVILCHYSVADLP